MGLSINHAFSEYAEKLHSIEEELRAQPVTEEIREHIIHELDEVHDGLSQLETTAAHVNRFATSFLEELRQKAVFLYGEVEDFFYKHEIDVIQDETKALTQTLEQKDFFKISKLIDSLKGHIKELLESYRPDLKERRILVFANIALEQAEGLLKGSIPSTLPMTEESLLEMEEILEEIAEYLGNNDRGGLKLLWARLSSYQRKLAMTYLNPTHLTISLLHDIEGSTYDEKVFSV